MEFDQLERKMLKSPFIVPESERSGGYVNNINSSIDDEEGR